jgi:hypothetical protein
MLLWQMEWSWLPNPMAIKITCLNSSFLVMGLRDFRNSVKAVTIRITRAVQKVDEGMLGRIWLELVYRWYICHLKM